MALFDPESACEVEAVNILMAASLEIFSECSEVVSTSAHLLTVLRRLLKPFGRIYRVMSESLM
jgi:hypothetical protein